MERDTLDPALRAQVRSLYDELGAGLTLVQQAQNFQLAKQRGIAALDITTVNDIIAGGITLLLEVLADIQSQLRDRQQALLGSPFADEYTAWDVGCALWLQAGADRIDQLRAQRDAA